MLEQQGSITQSGETHKNRRIGANSMRPHFNVIGLCYILLTDLHFGVISTHLGGSETSTLPLPA